jgi:hypothetical protein
MRDRKMCRAGTGASSVACILALHFGAVVPGASWEGIPMATANTVESRETISLIGSDKVDGTAVYGTDEKKIGELERVMIDKISGKVAYAVVSFGGFLGMGEDYYPMPWSTLKYETNLGGYRVGITKDQLENAAPHPNWL